MGWASTLEDIQERFESAIAAKSQLQIALEQEQISVQTKKAESQKILGIVDEIFLQIHQLLDIATDPDIDVAVEIVTGRNEVRLHSSKRRNAEDMVSDLALALDKRTLEIKGLKTMQKELRQQINRFKKELDEIYKSNPEIAYKMYPPKRNI